MMKTMRDDSIYDRPVQPVHSKYRERQTLNQQNAFETSLRTGGPDSDMWKPWIILIAEADNVEAHLRLFEHGCRQFQLDSSTTC